MAKNQEQDNGPRRLPPLKNVQHLNTPINVGGVDPEGFREISYITSPVEQLTFVLDRRSQIDIASILADGLDNEGKAEVLKKLTPGLEIVGADGTAY